MDELKQAQEHGEVTITYALERWLASVKADNDSGNEHTHSKYKTAAKHIETWARSNELIRLSQITPDALDHWKSSWSPKAKNPYNRIGKTTAGRRLEKVKRFLLRQDALACSKPSSGAESYQAGPKRDLATVEWTL